MKKLALSLGSLAAISLLSLSAHAVIMECKQGDNVSIVTGYYKVDPLYSCPSMKAALSPFPPEACWSTNQTAALPLPMKLPPETHGMLQSGVKIPLQRMKSLKV